MPPAPRKKQRLIVCLDGTWNRQDSNTNILHHFTMALESEPPHAEGDVIQRRYYQRGVGTGVLDGVTGGAFGFGLELNVREAYNWLAEHYQDGATAAEDDEIFVFGFSRGAYTARSLVGFIASVGLVRRGAPLEIASLWERYCIEGREREQRKSGWDSFLRVKPSGYKRLNELVPDRWTLPDGARSDLSNLNPSERLLATWSRRVRITYLGIYDTVGAMGIDALAIPGIRSKLAMHHNMRITSLVQRCRHALAVDEHRPSFSHTPMVQYVGHRLRGTAAETQTYWEKDRTDWSERIRQQWFVGAHSNIGGGYPENELSQAPYQWVLEGATDAHLRSEDYAFTPPDEQPTPRDSYAEFAKPFWTEIIRGKRFYRAINPEPEVRAGLPGEDGYTLHNLPEEIHADCDRYYNHQDYRPPNLWEYRKRLLEDDPSFPQKAEEQKNDPRMKSLLESQPRHTWVGTRISSHLTLVLWGTGAGLGFLALNHLFSARLDQLPPAGHADSMLEPWFVTGAALFFVLVDWCESAANLTVAKGRQSPAWRALLDTIYWTRTLGFVLFVCGALSAPVALWRHGWHTPTWTAALALAWTQVKIWWTVPLGAALGVMLGTWWDRHTREQRGRPALAGAAIAIAIAILAVPVLVLCGWAASQVVAPMWPPGPEVRLLPTRATQTAGMLLLLQFGIFYLLQTRIWAAAPTSQRNLQPVTELQRCWTPGQVTACFDRWQDALSSAWDPRDQDRLHGPAARAMYTVVREELWRDLLGYIPLYSLIFTTALYFGGHNLGCSGWLQRYGGIPLWAWIPGITLLADGAEDWWHLEHVRHRAAGDRPGWWLTLGAKAMTSIKLLTLLQAMAFTLWALVDGTHWVAVNAASCGWRGSLALLVSGTTVVVALVLGFNWLKVRVAAWWAARQASKSPPADPALA